jgi:3-oxoacyl-[acyl-carrier protein] reductase
MSLQNQVALVTGASRGIGRAIAIRLAQEGCDIAINYQNNIDAAKETQKLVQDLGRKAILIQADVSSHEQSEVMAAKVMETFERIDILVNNAGTTRNDLLLSMPPEDIEFVIRTNLLGVIYPMKSVAPHMLGQRYGRIVNISSVAGEKPGRGQAAYAAAKGGVESLTRAMAIELASRNILVNAVAPGVIVTDMSTDIREQRETELMARLLLKRYAAPSEVADLVLYLASPKNLYMTGEVLHLNGGMKMA